MELPTSLEELPRTLLGFHVELARRAPDPRGDLLSRVARLEADADLRRLLNQYAYAYDAGDLEAMMEIYADDCVLVNGQGTFVGRGAVRDNYTQAIEARVVAFHHLSDVEVCIDDDLDEAWATGYLHNLAVRDGNPGGTMASCVFHARLSDDRWKVAECRIAVTNQHSFGPPARREPTAFVARPSRPTTTADLLDDAPVRPARPVDAP